MIKSRNTDIKEIPSIDSLKHAEFKKCCEDARYFINEHLFKITPEQDTLLGGIVGDKEMSQYVRRRIGSTTIGLAYVIWASIANQNHSSLVLNHTFDACNHSMKVLQEMLSYIPAWMCGNYRFNKTEITFDNGSTIRIVAASHNVFSGISPDLTFADNAFMINKGVEDIFERGIKQKLLSRGRKVFQIASE